MEFEEAEQLPHFEITSFRVKKKIFATLNIKEKRATIKLSPIDQSVFTTISTSIYAVPNKWGKQGWTHLDLQTIKKEILNDALTTSYCLVAPKNLARKYLPGI